MGGLAVQGLTGGSSSEQCNHSVSPICQVCRWNLTWPQH